MEVQPLLAGYERRLLDLDPPVAAIPWELLDAGSAALGCDRRPWAARAAGLARRLPPSGAACARQEQLADLFYPAMNCLALELVLRMRAGRAPAFDPALRRAARASLLAKFRDDPDFWSQLGLVEFEVLDALAEGRLAAAAPRIGRVFAEPHARMASTGWWGSGADQADLIYGAWLRHGQAADRDAARGLWRLLLRYGGKSEAEIARITDETGAEPVAAC